MVPTAISLIVILLFTPSILSGRKYLSGVQWALLGGSSSTSSDRPSTMPKCIDIPQNFTLCHGMKYQMRLPNLLDHETMEEAIEQSDAWTSLLRLHCHTDTKLFLCSLFAPICLTNMDKHIQPCQSLCKAVQEGCEVRMTKYGFPWPAMLNCSRFPVDNDMCIKPMGAQNKKRQEKCKSCAQVATFENLMDHFCRENVDYVMKVRLKSHNASHLAILRKARSFKGNWTRASEGGTAEGFVKLSEQRDETNCPCPLENGGKSTNYLAMAGETRRWGMVARLILPWRGKDKNFKSAVRKFRKVNCTSLGREVRESVLKRSTFKRTLYG